MSHSALAPVAVVLDEHTVVEPDLIFVARAQRGIIRDKAIFGAPALLVEITSPSTASRDRGLKRDRYARAGVGCYWMIDPRTGTLRALHLVEGAYEVEAEVGRRGAFHPALFPGLALRMRDVLTRSTS